MEILKKITFKRIETISIILFSISAILKGEITVFYMLYLFWWQAVIHVLVNSIKTLTLNKYATYRSELKEYFKGNFFLLFLYLFFIIIIYGLILNFNNNDLIILNFQVMFFKSWSFNLNLIVILISAVFFTKLDSDDVTSNIPVFSANNIILHISIILGALMQFFIVLRFESIFTEDNFWGSVLVISPFLILRALLDGFNDNPSQKVKDS